MLPVTVLSTSDFEMQVVPSEGIASFGSVNGDIFSDSGFVSHFLLSPSVISEMGLRFGYSAREFLDDHAHLSSTHCLRVSRSDGVFDDGQDRSPVESIRALIYGLVSSPSAEALSALDRLESSPEEKFHAIRFPQRIRDITTGTDRFVYRRILVIRTDAPTPPTDENED